MTPHPVTDTQIEQLRTEAATAGDLEQVALCERALEGDLDAQERCARVIRQARAQD